MHQTMRPLGFGDTLDGAFTLLRRNFSTFFAIALLPQLPLMLFYLVAPGALAGVADGSVVFETTSVLLMPYTMLATVVMMGALTHAAGQLYQGDHVEIRGALGRGLRRSLPLIGVSIISWFMIGFGLLLFIVPGLIVIAMYFAVYPAVVLENRGPLKALGRSRELSRGGRGRILGVLLVTLLITYLPMIALGTIAGVSMGVAGAFNTATLQGTNLWLTGLIQAGSYVLNSITTPFLIIVTVLLYFDRRARTEAPDLEAAVAELENHPA